MCSKCFKTTAGDAQLAAPARAPVEPKEVAVPEPAAALEAAASVAAPELPAPVVASSGEEAPPPNPSRCFSCSKKVGLTGFKCRCGFTFCSGHRYADAHACTFDYKAAAATLLTKANPLVTASKVQKARANQPTLHARIAPASRAHTPHPADALVGALDTQRGTRCAHTRVTLVC